MLERSPITPEHTSKTDSENDLFDFGADDFDDIPHEPDHEAAFISWFIDPEATAIQREVDDMPPLDAAAYEEWLNGLSPDELKRVESARDSYQREKARYERWTQVHDKLITTVPELYWAKLPGELEQRLDGKRYGLGFNQTGGAESIEEAEEYLRENAGVDTSNYDLTHRFLMFDSDMSRDVVLGPSGDIAQAVDTGYFRDPDTGRFVAAFPVTPDVDLVQERLSDAINLDPEHVLSPDAFTKTQLGESYSTKYIAGFIDRDGTFWSNRNFGVSDEPQFERFKRAVETEQDKDFV